MHWKCEFKSLIDNDEVQELWAGLFASSCTLSGQDDENLIFVDLLKQLTVLEAAIIKYACLNAQKVIHTNGLISSGELKIHCRDLTILTGVQDVHRLDRELDHLRSIELITGGFAIYGQELIADITPSPLALNLFIRSQGSDKSIVDYWRNSLITNEQYKKDKEEKEQAEIKNGGKINDV